MAEEQQGGFYRVEVIASLFGVTVRRVQQLTQEGIISTTKTKEGKTSHADNHYLDCEVYATAAADILGVRTLHLNEIQENEQPKKQETTQYTPEEHWISQNEGSWV